MSFAAPSGRVQGEVTRWMGHKNMGFVGPRSHSSAVFPNNTLCNVDLREGLTLEYEVGAGKKPGQTIATHIMPIIRDVRMGERVDLVHEFDLDSAARAEGVRWQQHVAVDDVADKLAQSKLIGGSAAAGAAVDEATHDQARSLWQSYSPQRLMFYGWGALSELRRSTLRFDQLLEGPTCSLNLAPDQLPKYRPIRKAFSVQPTFENEGEEFKPTLLVAMLGAMRSAQPQSDPLDALRQYAVVTARKQLKALMCLPERGSLLLYAYRPAEGAPVVLERGRTYEEQPHLIGAQWERKVMVKGEPAEQFTSVYNLMAGAIGEYRVLLTGELDGLDADAAHPLEVTTSPLGSAQDEQRVLERWVQSYLCAVPNILRANFHKPEHPDDPAVFEPKDVIVTPITELPVRAELKERAFRRAAALFRALTEHVQAAEYFQVLILRGRVTVSRLADPSRRPSATSDAFVSSHDLRQMAELVRAQSPAPAAAAAAAAGGADAPAPLVAPEDSNDHKAPLLPKSAASSAVSASASAAAQAPAEPSPAVAIEQSQSAVPSTVATPIDSASKAEAVAPGGPGSSSSALASGPVAPLAPSPLPAPVCQSAPSPAPIAAPQQAECANSAGPASGSRVLLWVDPRVDGNSRLKAAAKAAGVHVVSLVTGDEAARWLRGPGRAWCRPDTAHSSPLRIISAHALTAGDPPELLQRRSLVTPVLAALQELHSDSRVLIFCNRSYPSAQVFVRQQQHAPLTVTIDDHKALQFVCFR